MRNVVKSMVMRLALYGLQALFLFACAPAFAQDDEYEYDVPASLEDVLGAAQDYLDGVFPGDFSSFSLDDWDVFWQEVEEVLNSRSLESLAVMQPVVDQGLVFLDAIPSWRPTTDWLRQRVDYFDLAGDVVYRNYSPYPVRVSFEWTPTRGLGGGGGAGGWKKPGKQPAKTAPNPRQPKTTRRPSGVAPDVVLRRSRIVQDQATWLDRLSERKLPERASELVPMLKQVFKSEGLPPALVWIAEVESTMNPEAKSPAGAMGLFQLMPATAQRFGLRTGLFDERKTPEKNARAAAKYLNILYKRFKSWPLALAAYNSGEGRVGSLLKKCKANSFDGIADDLSVETRMYVPKVIAIVRIREKIDVLTLPGPTAGIPQLYAYRNLAPLCLFPSESNSKPLLFSLAW